MLAKWILLSALCTNVCLASVSNVIVFGDSLSDSGNFPETEVLDNPTWLDISQHVYVPPSNPVNNSKQTFETVMGEKIDFPYNSQNDHTPFPLSKVGRVSDQQKRYRSFNWAEFFVAYLGKPNPLIPHIRLLSTPVDFSTRKDSINYAWWAAVTGEGCYNELYEHVRDYCNLKELIQRRQQFIHTQHFHFQPLQVLVPGLQAQVKLFLDDLKAKRVYADAQTIYVIYVGGNGLMQADTDIRNGHFLHAWHLASGGGSADIGHAIRSLLNAGVDAKRFMVVSLYDLALTPRVRPTFWSHWIAQAFSKRFNKHLKQELQKIRMTYNTEIEYFDNFAFMNQLATHDFFKSSLGQQCDQHNTDSPYYQPNPPSANCKIDDDHGYLYWNNSHLSLLVNGLLGKRMAERAKKLWA